MLQNNEFNVNYSSEGLIIKMYQKKNSDFRTANDNDDINIGNQKYTYGEIKGVFDGIGYLSRKTAFIDDPNFYPDYFPKQNEVDLDFGFNGMVFSLLTDRYSNNQLADDVHNAMLNRFVRGASILGADPDEMIETVRLFESIPSDESGFANRLIKSILLYQTDDSGSAYAMGSSKNIYIREWNWLINNSNNIDKSKYQVKFDSYVG
jgi:hypothetical protein